MLVHGDTSYLLLAADAATPARIAFYLRHTSGILGVALSPDRIDALRLAPANAEPPGLSGAVAMVPVDLGTRADRGASAGDRAATILALADPDSRPGQFIRPGHVVPLRTPRTSRADERDPAVAALDLARLSGRGAAAVLAPILDGEGRVAGAETVAGIVAEHGIALLEIEDLIRYRRLERPATRAASVALPTRLASLICHAWEMPDGTEHLALTRGGSARPLPQPPRVVVHHECRAGDVFASRACRCHAELNRALTRLGAGELDALVYLRSSAHTGKLVCPRIGSSPSTASDPGSDPVCAQILAELCGAT